MFGGDFRRPVTVFSHQNRSAGKRSPAPGGRRLNLKTQRRKRNAADSNVPVSNATGSSRMTTELTQPQSELGQAPADGQGQSQGHRRRRRRRKNKSSQPAQPRFNSRN
jgi:hypothetical protein